MGVETIRSIDGNTIERIAGLAVELSPFAEAVACDAEVRRVCDLDCGRCDHTIIYLLPFALVVFARQSIRTRNVALGGA